MTPCRRIFDDLAGEYDRWFDDHGAVYGAELRLLRSAVPRSGRGLELGVGSGRFAAPLGIANGIDPSLGLLTMAKGRGVDAVRGEGEHLPYRAGSFDYVLMMTVICYLEDPAPVIDEVFRVVSGRGEIIVGFIERDGEIARQYREEKARGRFLSCARFLSVEDVTGFVQASGFSGVTLVQRTKGFCIVRGTKP